LKEKEKEMKKAERDKL